MNKMFLLCIVVCAISRAIADPGYFSYHDLETFASALHSVAQAHDVLNDTVEALAEPKSRLDSTLKTLLDTFSTALNTQDDADQAALEDVQQRVQALFLRVNRLEARLRGGQTAVTRVSDDVIQNWSRIYVIGDSQKKQEGVIAKMESTLNRMIEKVNGTIEASTEREESSIVQTLTNANRAEEFINSRKCVSDFHHLEVDAETGEGTAELNLAQNFQFGVFDGDNRPTVSCGIQGYISRLDLESSKPYSGYDYGHGYGYGKEDEIQRTAFTLVCEGDLDTIKIRIVDQGRGRNNRVGAFYVQVQACSLAALAGFLP